MKLEEQLIRLNEDEIFGKVHSVDNEIQKKQFEKLTELQALNGTVTDKNIFIFGFNLAVQLMAT